MQWIAVVFLLLGATSLIESTVCPPGGWIPLNYHCYLLSPTKLNWFQAQQFCEDKGGYLAEILSQSEQTNLEALLNIGKYNNYWIGLSDLAQEGKFQWQHSFTPLGEYKAWCSGEPDNKGSGDEDCVHLRPYSTPLEDRWCWNDLDCGKVDEDTHDGRDTGIFALCQC